MLFRSLRAIHTRALADYLWLGAAAGLGILSKYIFAVGVAGFLVAMLWEREARRRLRLDGLWLSAAVAMLVVAPYLWWVATNEYSFFTLAKGITGGKGLALDPIVWSKGFLNLVLALVEFAIPFVLIFAALFPQSFRRVAPVMPESDRMNLRLLEVAMLAAVTMMLAAVFFVGTEAFKPRWMHQVLMPLPIYLFLRAKYAPISVRRYQYFALICAGFALAVVASRFIIWETNVDGCKRCREYRPYDRFAADRKSTRLNSSH